MLSTNILALFKSKAKFVSRQIKVCMLKMFRVHLVILRESTIVIMNLRTSIKSYIRVSISGHQVQGYKKQLKIVYATIRTFSHGDWRHGERKKNFNLTRPTRKAFPRLWRQKTPLAQKGFSTSFPTGKQLLSPLHPDTTIGNIHLQMSSQSF